MCVLSCVCVWGEMPLRPRDLRRARCSDCLPTQVLSKVLSWQQDPSNLTRRVLLMPAVRDATATPAFPQPPFAIDAARLPAGCGERLSSLQNPSSFVVPTTAGGGVTVSACSQDVLMHLSAGEVSRGAQQQGQDRMQALASHVVGQRR